MDVLTFWRHITFMIDVQKLQLGILEHYSMNVVILLLLEIFGLRRESSNL